jgi:CubicO group peptidase (beta-lactamase class C family)
MFPGKRFGGGALSVYLHGEPVVDVWKGWADRDGEVPWSADTAPMVFSATKGMASTVIHRLADRGLIDYEAPVAEYWPAFGANGKANMTVREVMKHTAGLSGLRGATQEELLDHVLMEERLAAASPGRLLGQPAYHALTYGWLMSGLARAVTGKDMRVLFREELAEPLGTDGIHLGRPPVDSPTRAAEIIMPQDMAASRLITGAVQKLANQFSGGYRSMYFPGVIAAVQGNMAMLDAEIPAANGVVTARALARMYGAIANGGEVGGRRFLSRDLTAGLVGRPSLRPDRSIIMPMSFHLGYHGLPLPGVLPGFGHVGLGGSLGWAIPESGLAIGFVHNRLLTPLLVGDQAGFVATAALVRRGAALAGSRGYRPVAEAGAHFASAEGSLATPADYPGMTVNT